MVCFIETNEYLILGNLTELASERTYEVVPKEREYQTKIQYARYFIRVYCMQSQTTTGGSNKFSTFPNSFSFPPTNLSYSYTWGLRHNLTRLSFFFPFLSFLPFGILAPASLSFRYIGGRRNLSNRGEQISTTTQLTQAGLCENPFCFLPSFKLPQ